MGLDILLEEEDVDELRQVRRTTPEERQVDDVRLARCVVHNEIALSNRVCFDQRSVRYMTVGGEEVERGDEDGSERAVQSV